MIRSLRLLLLLVLAGCGSSSSSGGSSSGGGGGGPLPAGWEAKDVGAPALGGSSSYAGGVFTLNGSGADIWGSADAFQFSYVALSGDGEIRARVLGLDPTDVWAKAGVMIRETTAAGSKFFLAAVTPGNGHISQWRTTTDGGAAWPGTSESGGIPYWVRVVRQGSTFTGFSSPDGVTWNTTGSVSITMTAGTLVGLAVTAHNNGALSACSMTDFSIADGAGNSLWPPPPSAPALSIATPQNFSPVINLTWTPASSVAPITAYNILRGSGSGNETPYQTVSGSTTSYSDTGVTFGATYYYVVEAVAGTAVSPASNEVFGSPQPLPPRTASLGSEDDQCGCGTAMVPDFAAVAAGAAFLLLLSLALRR